ncbi:alkaline phosphatase PhoX [Ottowia sp.]|uniref:PhoX family protein n=1 Tax=Ottowia sp. TaxID=1898956 RepID=UPI0025F7DAC4|nr:alkaline phosphatase PhoX [Ottowia sp.]
MIAAWGEPVGLSGEMPAFKDDAANTAADQEAQMGMHHDGIHFFAQDGSKSGLLVMNHEYVDDGLLHTDGLKTWTAEKVRKAQAAHGVAVIEVEQKDGKWQMVRPSPWAPYRAPVGPPAPPDPAEQLRQRVPWGTYLTCEENSSSTSRAHGPTPTRQGTRSSEHDALRPPAVRHPDPPPGPPRGPPPGIRAKTRAEYIYKFVSRDAIQPGGARANTELLDHATLYVAKLDADGKGRWLALTHGQGPLTAANGFADQGEVLIKTRQASDLLGATKMDRPEWIDIDKQGWVYCTLTNNSNRGADKQPGVDAMNPRANNTMGNIIRWKEDGDFDGATFQWNHFVLAGDPANERADAKGNVKGDAFGCPDGLWTDAPRCVVDPDRHVHLGHGQGRFEGPGQQPLPRAALPGGAGVKDGRTAPARIAPGKPVSAATRRRPTGRPAPPARGHVVIRKADGGVIGT